MGKLAALPRPLVGLRERKEERCNRRWCGGKHQEKEGKEGKEPHNSTQRIQAPK